VLPADVLPPTVPDLDSGQSSPVFPLVTDSDCARYAKILLAPAPYVAESIYEREAMEMERMLQGHADLDPLERRYIEMARDTSLGRMHASTTSSQPASLESNLGVAIPGSKPRALSACSTPRTTPQSSFGSPPHSRIMPIPGPGDRSFHFYQASDGSQVYLHPLDIRILKQEFGDYSAFPAKFNAKILQLEEGAVNSDLRKRFRYLGHLPLGCDVTFVEVSLDGLVSEATLEGWVC